MTKPWSEPENQPLERLQVTDGVLINSKKWQIAHDYHHRRQNLHYQSLNQEGIVCGLSVHLIKKPAQHLSETRPGESSTQYEFFLKFQPGIAIDRYGNFIIVEQEQQKSVATKLRPGESLVVYFVISYKDPSQLKNPQEVVTEQYKIEEKTSFPSEYEVELCRVNLTDPQNIKIANDVFLPQNNELDFRYRCQAKWRPLYIIRAAIYKDLEGWQEAFCDDVKPSNFSCLLQSIDQLDSSLGTLKMGNGFSFNSLSDYDLIYLTEKQFENFQEVNVLKEYLVTGGVVFIEHSTQAKEVGKLMQIKKELRQKIIEIKNENEVGLNEDLERLNSNLQNVNDKLKEIIGNLSKFYNQRLNINLQLVEYPKPHPLLKTPFLFHQLPSINKQTPLILSCDGIIVVVGNLSSAWGLNDDLFLSREDIRSAQEMGTNILHFAWHRRELTRLVRQV